MKKKILLFAVVACLVLAFSVGVSAATFSDISGHWAENYIEDAVDAGYIDGYEDGTFRPDQSVTRAEFVKMLNNALGIQYAKSFSYSDVKEGIWYYDELGKAAYARYIAGYEDGTFGPARNVTRQEASVMLYRVLSDGPDLDMGGLQKMADFAKVAPWGQEGMAKLFNLEYIVGYPDNTIRPDGNLTRSEAVALIERICAQETIYRDPVEVNLNNTTFERAIFTGGVTLEGNLADASVDFSECVILSPLTVEGGGYWWGIDLMDCQKITELIADSEGAQITLSGNTTVCEALFKDSVELCQNALTGNGIVNAVINSSRKAVLPAVDGEPKEIDLAAQADIYDLHVYTPANIALDSNKVANITGDAQVDIALKSAQVDTITINRADSLFTMDSLSDVNDLFINNDMRIVGETFPTMMTLDKGAIVYVDVMPDKSQYTIIKGEFRLYGVELPSPTAAELNETTAVDVGEPLILTWTDSVVKNLDPIGVVKEYEVVCGENSVVVDSGAEGVDISGWVAESGTYTIDIIAVSGNDNYFNSAPLTIEVTRLDAPSINMAGETAARYLSIVQPEAVDVSVMAAPLNDPAALANKVAYTPDVVGEGQWTLDAYNFISNTNYASIVDVKAIGSGIDNATNTYELNSPVLSAEIGRVDTPYGFTLEPFVEPEEGSLLSSVVVNQPYTLDWECDTADLGVAVKYNVAAAGYDELVASMLTDSELNISAEALSNYLADGANTLYVTAYANSENWFSSVPAEVEIYKLTAPLDVAFNAYYGADGVANFEVAWTNVENPLDTLYEISITDENGDLVNSMIVAGSEVVTEPNNYVADIQELLTGEEYTADGVYDVTVEVVGSGSSLAVVGEGLFGTDAAYRLALDNVPAGQYDLSASTIDGHYTLTWPTVGYTGEYKVQYENENGDYLIPTVTDGINKLLMEQFAYNAPGPAFSYYVTSFPAADENALFSSCVDKIVLSRMDSVEFDSLQAAEGDNQYKLTWISDAPNFAYMIDGDTDWTLTTENAAGLTINPGYTDKVTVIALDGARSASLIGVWNESAQQVDFTISSAPDAQRVGHLDASSIELQSVRETAIEGDAAEEAGLASSLFSIAWNGVDLKDNKGNVVAGSDYYMLKFNSASNEQVRPSTDGSFMTEDWFFGYYGDFDNDQTPETFSLFNTEFDGSTPESPNALTIEACSADPFIASDFVEVELWKAPEASNVKVEGNLLTWDAPVAAADEDANYVGYVVYVWDLDAIAGEDVPSVFELNEKDLTSFDLSECITKLGDNLLIGLATEGRDEALAAAEITGPGYEDVVVKTVKGLMDSDVQFVTTHDNAYRWVPFYLSDVLGNPVDPEGINVTVNNGENELYSQAYTTGGNTFLLDYSTETAYTFTVTLPESSDYVATADGLSKTVTVNANDPASVCIVLDYAADSLIQATNLTLTEAGADGVDVVTENVLYADAPAADITFEGTVGYSIPYDYAKNANLLNVNVYLPVGWQAYDASKIYYTVNGSVKRPATVALTAEGAPYYTVSLPVDSAENYFLINTCLNRGRVDANTIDAGALVPAGLELAQVTPIESLSLISSNDDFLNKLYWALAANDGTTIDPSLYIVQKLATVAGDDPTTEAVETEYSTWTEIGSTASDSFDITTEGVGTYRVIGQYPGATEAVSPELTADMYSTPADVVLTDTTLTFKYKGTVLGAALKTPPVPELWLNGVKIGALTAAYSYSDGSYTMDLSDYADLINENISIRFLATEAKPATETDAAVNPIMASSFGTEVGSSVYPVTVFIKDESGNTVESDVTFALEGKSATYSFESTVGGNVLLLPKGIYTVTVENIVGADQIEVESASELSSVYSDNMLGYRDNTDDAVAYTVCGVKFDADPALPSNLVINVPYDTYGDIALNQDAEGADAVYGKYGDLTATVENDGSLTVSGSINYTEVENGSESQKGYFVPVCINLPTSWGLDSGNNGDFDADTVSLLVNGEPQTSYPVKVKEVTVGDETYDQPYIDVLLDTSDASEFAITAFYGNYGGTNLYSLDGALGINPRFENFYVNAKQAVSDTAYNITVQFTDQQLIDFGCAIGDFYSNIAPRDNVTKTLLKGLTNLYIAVTDADGNVVSVNGNDLIGIEYPTDANDGVQLNLPAGQDYGLTLYALFDVDNYEANRAALEGVGGLDSDMLSEYIGNIEDLFDIDMEAEIPDTDSRIYTTAALVFDVTHDGATTVTNPANIGSALVTNEVFEINNNYDEVDAEFDYGIWPLNAEIGTNHRLIVKDNSSISINDNFTLCLNGGLLQIEDRNSMEPVDDLESDNVPFSIIATSAWKVGDDTIVGGNTDTEAMYRLISGTLYYLGDINWLAPVEPLPTIGSYSPESEEYGNSVLYMTSNNSDYGQVIVSNEDVSIGNATSTEAGDYIQTIKLASGEKLYVEGAGLTVGKFGSIYVPTYAGIDVMDQGTFSVDGTYAIVDLYEEGVIHVAAGGELKNLHGYLGSSGLHTNYADYADQYTAPSAAPLDIEDIEAKLDLGKMTSGNICFEKDSILTQTEDASTPLARTNMNGNNINGNDEAKNWLGNGAPTFDGEAGTYTWTRSVDGGYKFYESFGNYKETQNNENQYQYHYVESDQNVWLPDGTSPTIIKLEEIACL